MPAEREAEPAIDRGRRRRGVLVDVLYVVAPLLLLAVVWAAVTWYSRVDRLSANRDLVASILRNFAAGIEHGDPLPAGIERSVRRTDLVLTIGEELRLERLSEHLLGDGQGRIADVWGTPLRARRGCDRLEVRSAGRDRVMDTGDDEVAVRPVPVVPAPTAAQTNAPRSDDRGASAGAP